MKKRIWLRVLLALVILGAAACVWELISSQNPYILPLKRQLQYGVLGMSTEDTKAETMGLESSYQVHIYVDGQESTKLDLKRDSKRIYRDSQTTRLVNYLDGYQVDLPAGAQADFSLSPLYTTLSGEGFSATISREKATYESTRDVITFELSTFLPFLFEDHTVESYVQHYEYRFLLNEDWQKANGVTVDTFTTSGGVQVIQARIQGMEEDREESYLYATYYTGSREYVRVMIRYDADRPGLEKQLMGFLDRTRVFDPVGTGHYDTHYDPKAEDMNWSQETRALYESLLDPDTPLMWGIFLQDFYETGFDGELTKMEDALDYTFPVVLYYRHLPTHEFPTEVMEENYEAGRLVELTLQLTDNNNEDMFAWSPMLAIYRGELDEEIRAWARGAKEFGHPFLFRLNNEMNSDWTSYGGVVNLCDPQIFTAVWQRIYNIFQEEGVDNCIWIYNPNDRNAPPSKWNHSLAYYPGNGYAQLLGVTGYNNGTYYTQWAEEWREFKDIYDTIWQEYYPHFGSFPWMITEFASSSYGGDKVKWMENMFREIHNYPNIKIAVWFSYADFDGDTPARTYWLDETPETLETFRKGLAGEFN